MKISIFGLGYVGTVTMACLARDGHEVIGVDVTAAKVEALAAGRSPIAEPGLSDLLADAVQNGRLSATTRADEAVGASTVSLVSVGTPSRENGEPDLSYVERVCREIGQAVGVKRESHTVVLRSTVPPGTTVRCAEILTDASAGGSIHVAFNPEFLREGSAIADFDHPPYTVIGTDDRVAEAVVRRLYASVSAPVHVVRPEVAEMVKYAANAWHATKIVFANEIGRLAKRVGVDGRQVMELITEDRKLNVSPAYMRPGFAYGGSCLPKDVRALLFQARHHDVLVPLLSSLPVSNDQQIQAAVDAVLAVGRRRVVVLGLAFKAATDDLRESPSVALVKRLIGEGCEVAIYAPGVDRNRLMGANLSYIREHLPHFEKLMVQDLRRLIEWGDVFVATDVAHEIIETLTDLESKAVVDVSGVIPSAAVNREYRGIGW